MINSAWVGKETRVSLNTTLRTQSVRNQRGVCPSPRNLKIIKNRAKTVNITKTKKKHLKKSFKANFRFILTPLKRQARCELWPRLRFKSNQWSPCTAYQIGINSRPQKWKFSSCSSERWKMKLRKVNFASS